MESSYQFIFLYKYFMMMYHWNYFWREQYAEGKMRGAAPGKKTAGLQQKNIEV